MQQNCLMFDKIRPFSDGYDEVQSPDAGNHECPTKHVPYVYIYIDVSENGGTPKSSILIGIFPL